MRFILIITGVLVLLAGGGAGYYFFVMQPAQQNVDENGEVIAEAEPHKERPKHVEFVELDPMILPIIDNEGVNQMLSVVIALEVWAPEDTATVTHMSPKLKDAYIQRMYGVLNEYAAMKGGVIEVTDLKTHLSSATTDVLGPNVVHDILLQVLQQKSI